MLSRKWSTCNLRVIIFRSNLLIVVEVLSLLIIFFFSCLLFSCLSFVVTMAEEETPPPADASTPGAERQLHSSHSTGMEASVLRVKDVNFSVGKGDKQKQILTDINVKVKWGHVLACE